MGSEQVLLGVLALGAGALVGVLLFVPFVAISYRRRGSLSFGRLSVWAAALVYGWAIWAYTLLPLPDPAELSCSGYNLNPFAFVDDVSGAIARAGGRPLAALADPAVLQLALNVLLFVPLGFFVRVLGGRGILVAGLVGLALSAFIETTQLTGVWGLYPCSYRVFDVDDLLTNTTGALLGSLLSLAVPRRFRTAGAADAEPSQPRPVTKPRRLLAMTADWVGFTLAAATVSLAVQLVLLYVRGDRDAAVDGSAASLVGTLTAAAIWFVITIATGRSIGDLAVQLRYAGGPLPVPVARLLRFVGGVGGYAACTLLPGDWSGLALAYALVLLVIALSTPGGRGLPWLLSRQPLHDARAATGSHPAVGERSDAR